MQRIVRDTLPFALTALAATPLTAQSTWSITPYVAASSSLPGEPLLLGVSVDYGMGVFGVRAGGAMDPATGDAGFQSGRAGNAWGLDLGVTLALPEALATAELGGLDPRVYGGLGVQNATSGADAGATVPVAAYGIGLSYPLSGAISLETDAIRRVALEDAIASTGGSSSGWEYRAGISFRFGGAARSYPSRPGTRASRPAGRDPSSGRTSARASSIIDTGDDYLGTPYVWGGDTPSEGFDCSGFVQYVFARNGVNLPRTSRQMAGAGRSLPVRAASLEAADLMLFAGDGNTIDHVAIYVGNGRILHSSKSGGGVTYDDLSTQRGRWFTDHFVVARRVIEGGSSLVSELMRWAAPAPGSFDPPDLAPRRRR